VGVTIADHIASQNMTAGILAALFARERTGTGQRVDVSLVGGQIWAQASEYSYYFLTGQVPGRSNTGHPLLHAVYGIFPTADGYLSLAGVPPALREAFYRTIGREDLLQVERFAALLMEPHDKLDLFAELSVTFRTRTTAQWVGALRAAGQRVAPVRRYDEVAVDPMMWENGYFVEAPDTSGSPTKVVGSPIRMSHTPLQPSAAAPELGQNTEEILLEVGYDWDDIARLRDAGAI
jgi:formyl-CoA transferase/CoA:oxalate CoA-transferase